MPAILAILTFSKQMDINWDYIKECSKGYLCKTYRRNIVVFKFCSPNNWLLHADTVYTHEPTVTQVICTSDLAQIIVKKNIIYNANREPISLFTSSYQFFAIILGLTNSNTNDTAK